MEGPGGVSSIAGLRQDEIDSSEEDMALPIQSIKASVDFPLKMYSSQNDLRDNRIWACHICHEKFACDNSIFILMHFRDHQPSTQENSPRLSLAVQNKFFAKSDALTDLTLTRGILNVGLCSSPKSAIEENTSRTSSPTIRKVAKKSCSGRPSHKTKSNNHTSGSSGDAQLRTVSKKSCSGLKHVKTSKKIAPEVSEHATSSKSKIEEIYVSSTKKKKKRKESTNADKISKHEPPRKKAKSNPEPVKKKNKPKKSFPKPPKVPSCAKLSSLMTDSMATIAKLLSERNPSMSTIQSYMDVSFPYRKFRYETTSTIRSMLADFPALHRWQILKHEFEKFKRASFAELDYKLQHELEVHWDEKPKAGHHSTKYPNTLIQKLLDNYKGEYTNEELERDTKLLCYGSWATGGKLEGTLYKQRTEEDMPFKSVTPTIDICGELGSSDVRITVYCEETLITDVPNFYEAVMCSYSLYWIFNLCYEKTAKSFYEELDCLIGE